MLIKIKIKNGVALLHLPICHLRDNLFLIYKNRNLNHKYFVLALICAKTVFVSLIDKEHNALPFKKIKNKLNPFLKKTLSFYRIAC